MQRRERREASSHNGNNAPATSIKALCKENKFDQAIDLYHSNPNTFSATYLIKALSNQTELAQNRGILEKIYNVYGALRNPKSKARPDSSAIFVLLDAVRRARGKLGEVLTMALDDVERFEIQMGASLVHILAAASGEAGDAVSAKRLLDLLRKQQMNDQSKGQERVKVLNIVDCGYLCKALVAPSAGGDSSFLEAVSFMETMQGEWGVMPDAQLCTILLSGCHGASSKHGKRIHEFVVQNDIDVNDFLAAALIRVYGRAEDIERAVAVFTAQQQRRQRRDTAPTTTTSTTTTTTTTTIHATPTVNVWNAIIRVHVARPSVGGAERAVALLNRMDAEGVRPDRATFLPLLPAVGKTRSLTLAKEVHTHIIKSDITIVDSRFALALINMFGQCGPIAEATNVFREFLQRRGSSLRKNESVWVYNALLSAVSNRKEDSAAQVLALYDEMLESGVPPDRATLAMALSACGNIGAKELERGKEIHRRVLDGRFPINEFVETALISMYSKCGSLEDALAVFDNHQRRLLGISSSSKTTRPPKQEETTVCVWNAIIGAHGDHGLFDQAMSFFHRMLENGVAPNEVTFSTVLAVCAALGSLPQGEEVRAIMTQHGVPINGFLVSGLISIYSKCGDLDQAVAVFDKWRLYHLLPWLKEPERVGVWNSMIGAYAKHKGTEEKALALFDEMTGKEGMRPTQRTYAMVLPMCGDTGALTRGRELHTQMLNSRVPINDFLGAALIDMYSKAGSLDEAINVFEEMRHHDDGRQCGVSAWNAMIGAYGDHRRIDDSLALFEEMTRLPKLKPDGVTLCVVLSTCSHGGMIVDAHELISSMAERFGIPPDERHHVCMIDVLGRAGHLQEAEDYLRIELPTNTLAWMTLLGACRLHGDVQRGETAEREIRSLNPTKKSIADSRVLMSNIYASAGRWKEKTKMRLQMQEEGVEKIRGSSNIEVNGRVNSFLVADKRHPHSKAIHIYLDALWAEMKAAGYIPLTDGILHDFITEEEKEHHLSHHSEKLAIAFGLMNTPEGTPLIITKNLRMCPDCHAASRFIARLKNRRIRVRDANTWHHFDPTTGECSCKEYW